MNIKAKGCWSIFLICMIVVGFLTLPAKAVETGVICLTELEHKPLTGFETVAPDGGNSARASGPLNIVISANSAKITGTSISLGAGETVTFDCTYTPASASVDFGLIAPDGQYYYFNVTDGSIDETILIEERGTYTVAIVNNSSYTVSITGTVRY